MTSEDPGAGSARASAAVGDVLDDWDRFTATLASELVVLDVGPTWTVVAARFRQRHLTIRYEKTDRAHWVASVEQTHTLAYRRLSDGRVRQVVTGQGAARVQTVGHVATAISPTSGAAAISDTYAAWLTTLGEGKAVPTRPGDLRISDLRHRAAGLRLLVWEVSGSGLCEYSPPTGTHLEPAPPAICGEHVAVTLSRTEAGGGRRHGLWVISLDDETTWEVWDDDFDLHSPAENNDGQLLVQASTRSHDATRYLNHTVRVIDPVTRSAECVHEGGSSWATPVGWMDGRPLLCVSDADGVRVVRLDASGGMHVIDHGPGVIESARLRHGRLVVHRSSATGPGTIRMINGRTGEAETVDELPRPDGTFSSRRSTRTASRPRPHVVGYEVLSGGRGEEDPVVVFCHGGPTMRGGGWSARWNPIPYLRLGATVALINPAGSEGYGRESNQVAWRSWRNIVESAAETLEMTFPDLCQRRLVLMGGSFGGYLALALAAHVSAEIVAAHATPCAPSRVSWASDSRWSWVREWSGVQPGSPRADDLDPQTLPLGCRYRLSHGLQDAVVPATETITLGRQLEDRGADVEVLLLPDVGHAITSALERSAWNRWIIDTIWGDKGCV